MPSFFTAMKQVWRRLGRSPGFTAITLITLAVGIGANTAIFTVVNSVLIKPLPYPAPERLVAIWQTAQGIGFRNVNASPASYFTYREEGKAFTDIGLWRTESPTITGVAEPETVRGLMVTDATLPLLGIQPARGRWFTRKEDSPEGGQTMMLSYGYWQRRFGGDESVLGRRVVVDGRPREVIGILGRDFRFMNFAVDIVLPFRFNRNEVFIGNFSYQALARLKPGVSIQQANADVARMIPLMLQKFRPIAGMSPKIFEQVKLMPDVRPLKEEVVGDVGKFLWVLMATVGIVLAIACANVANLLLVRVEGRQHELAVRTAIGASRWQIARELLAESLTLAILGGALGLALAYGGLRLLVALAPANLPRLDEIAIDRDALLFTLAASLVSGVLFGLLPVLKYAGARVNTGLRESGRTTSHGRERHRARNLLVTAQVALALVLLAGSGLMIRTLAALRDVAPGFTAPEQIQTLRVWIPGAQVREAERVARMHYDILQNLAAIPGVSSAALTTSITMDGMTSNDPIFTEDRNYDDGQMPVIRRYKSVSPGYFRTMGNRLVAGRDLTWEDIFDKRPVVLMSENLAREFWGRPEAAIGKRVREKPNGVWREVIGVAADERDDGSHREAPKIVYWPVMVKDLWMPEVATRRSVAFLVRTPRSGSSGLLRDLERAVWSVNPDLPLARVRTVREIYDRSMARTSFTLALLGIASGVALLLGVVGIYGVISYSVTQRTREIGIRIALGAEPSAVTGMFLRHGVLLTAVGTACGLAAAAFLTRLMSGLLFGVSALDPLTYAAVAAILFGAAVAATYVPARRATAVDPAQSLRAE